MVHRAIVLAHRLVFEGGSEISSASVALLQRNLSSLAQIGIRDVCVVDGEQAELLRARLALHEFPSLNVTVLSNRSWRKASGSAVLVARDFLAASDRPCLIVRGDRPLSRETLAELAGTELGARMAAVVVASPPDSDLSVEAKVRLQDGDVAEVSAIGMDMDHFDAVFTGHALVKPAIIEILARMSNPSLEDGLHALTTQGLVRALPGRIEWPWGIRQPTEVDDKVAALLEAKAHPRYTLLNPGPVNTTAGVKSAMVHHDVCHRDPSFSELLVSLTGKLRRIFRATPQHTTVLVTGSGTAAMECAISSTVPHDRKILIVDNGAFGERLHEIARLHEMDAVHLRYAWGDLVDPADVERAFEDHPDIAVVAMVHHETSVGLLNPVREVGAICRRNDAILIVDAVSSLGAENLDVVRDNIDICYGSANKCLHSISGAGFLCVSPRVWPKIEAIKPRSYYLNLKRYRYYMEELAQTPFTPAVSAYFALDAACAEFLADGHTRRFDMYRRRNQRLRSGLAALGMAPFTRTGRESHSVVTCCVPEGVTFPELYEGIKARGYIIYACKEVLADRFLQVANMGALPDSTIDHFLGHLREVIDNVRRQKQLAQPVTQPVAKQVMDTTHSTAAQSSRPSA
jgi:2-aminoethylphosphonate-pyruvate transaminase